MPPANSPTETSAGVEEASPYLEQLARLASPVPNLAATLVAQAEQDANDANVSFLRTPISQIDNELSDDQGRRRSAYLNTTDFTHARGHVERENQRRMRRAVLQNRRYTLAQLQELDQPPGNSSVLRIALRHPEGYQGWAPGTSDNEADETPAAWGHLRPMAQGPAEAERHSAERRQSREYDDLPHSPERQRGWRPDPTAALERSNAAIERLDRVEESHFVEDGSGGEPTMMENSLRATALLQSVRRSARFSARSRNQLENYIMERERTGHTNENRERSATGVLNRPTSSSLSPRDQDRYSEARARLQAEARERRERSSSDRLNRPSAGASLSNSRDQDSQSEFRVRMQSQRPRQNNLTEKTTPEVSLWLEEAIKYLERLRFCDTYSERITSAVAGGFIRGDYFTHNHEDFILDTSTIAAPTESSWLKVGGVFSGSQHASGGSSIHSYSLTNSSTRTSTVDRPARTTFPRAPNQLPTGSWMSSVLAHGIDSDESWPVKVTINSIDYDNMTLSGTMEAFNVPSKLIPPQDTSITTFLEGEIIDFNKYTLETKSFMAGSDIDSTYWRKLEPFSRLTDTEIVNNLVSIRWLSEELGKKWILMRWKERCFVTPSDAQSGLTISGFYYVSLRREDGHIEGLYYDPQSSPYQHLSLMPERRRAFPAYQFR